MPWNKIDPVLSPSAVQPSALTGGLGGSLARVVGHPTWSVVFPASGLWVFALPELFQPMGHSVREGVRQEVARADAPGQALMARGQQVASAGLMCPTLAPPQAAARLTDRGPSALGF